MSSTRKAPLRQRTATFNSPAVAVAAVVAVAVVAVAVVAVVAAAVVAVAASASVAAHPGVRAAGAKRGSLPRVINANIHGRARHRRPGLFMCTSGAAHSTVVSRGITIAPNSLLTKDIRAPIGL